MRSFMSLAHQPGAGLRCSIGSRVPHHDADGAARRSCRSIWRGTWAARRSGSALQCSALQIAGFIAAPIAGHLSDTIGRRQIIVSSMSMTAVILLSMILAGGTIWLRRAGRGAGLLPVRGPRGAAGLAARRDAAGTGGSAIGLLFGAQAAGAAIGLDRGRLAGRPVRHHVGVLFSCRDDRRRQPDDLHHADAGRQERLEAQPDVRAFFTMSVRRVVMGRRYGERIICPWGDIVESALRSADEGRVRRGGHRVWPDRGRHLGCHHHRCSRAWARSSSRPSRLVQSALNHVPRPASTAHHTWRILVTPAQQCVGVFH